MLMFSAACTLPPNPRRLSDCSGMIKLERRVSIAATSLSASTAAHASTPSNPPPKARKAEPHFFASASSFLSASDKSFQPSTSARAAPGLPANARSTAPDTAGKPVVVYTGGWRFRLVIPWSVNFAAFFGALPSRPDSSHSVHSLDTIANSRSFSTPGLSRRLLGAPAKSNCRTWIPDPTFMCSAAGHLRNAQARK